MGKPNRAILSALLYTGVILLGACGSDDASEESNTNKTTGSGETIVISGAVQKGPFIVGSTVTINLLSSTGDNTDSTIVTSTTDDLGSFNFSTQSQGLVQISSNGYYRNEITGELSAGTLTLRSIYNVSQENEQLAYTNMLTHITSNRILQLMQSEGLNYGEAQTQAEAEFLNSFSSVVPNEAEDTFTSLSIFNNDSSNGSAYLLTMSSIMYQYAIVQAHKNLTNPDAELSLLLNQLETDFSDNGVVDNLAMLAALKATISQLDPQQISDNIQSWINNNVEYTQVDMNLFLDSDLDGIFNSVDSDDDNDSVPDAQDLFPLDASESLDTDGDNIGDHTDTDDDNDNWSDVDEVTCGSDSLLSASVPADNDGDNICDLVDNDDDNDSWSDVNEIACGTDSLLSHSAPNDNDGDQICDVLDSDDDNDGISDADDCKPNTLNETKGILSLACQPIAGIDYVSNSFSGTTNALGEFDFSAGEQITFTIGGFEFGALIVKNEIKLSDFETEALPSSYRDFERYRQQTVLLSKRIKGIHSEGVAYANPQALDRLNNRLFLLYSLDVDNNAANGIDLTGNKTTGLAMALSHSNLPINLNTFEYVARLQSRSVLLELNNGVSGFSSLAQYLSSLDIHISYPEAMCEGWSNGDASPSSWSVNYKNAQQQTIMVDNFSSCPAIPDVNDAASYASNYSTDGKLRYLYLYDEQNRLTHEYRDTAGADVYSRLYQHDFTMEGDNSLEAVSYYYDHSGTKLLHDITTYTYLPSGLLDRKFVDDEDDDLYVYVYNLDNTLDTEFQSSDLAGGCWTGDINIVRQVNSHLYYDSGLLKQKSNEGLCAVNTYDYGYNTLGQTLAYKHNVDGKTDTDPATISYEYEQTSEFNDAGDITYYTSFSRTYAGELTNNQYEYSYDYDDEQRLQSYSQTSSNHRNSPSTSSTSGSVYSYQGDGKLEQICQDMACKYKSIYAYLDNGLIDHISTYSNSALSMKTFYIYDENNLIERADVFNAASLGEDLEPLAPLSPDNQVTLEYFPSGAISVMEQDGYKNYFRDPNGDNSSDNAGYYQWFDLDLGEHLNRTLAQPRAFEGGGET